MPPRLVIVVRLLLFLSCVFSLAALAIVPNPLAASPVPESVTTFNLPFIDVNPLGANFFLDREVELWKKEMTLSMARKAGIGWAKLLFSWEGIEPRKGYFRDDRLRRSTWEKYDELVRLARKYGLRVIARLDRAPNWSRSNNTYPTAPPDNLRDYGDFVYAVVSRYKGKVQHYQIWNEPNIFPEWGDRPVDPAGYTAMLRIAHQRAKEADPDAIVLSAPLAQTLETGSRNLNEIDYLEGIYRAGGREYFDLLLANAYGFERPPSDPPDPQVLNFARVRLLREVMERHGDGGKAIWINEYGWNASPPDFPKEKLHWQRVTEEEQARYTVEGIRLARSWGWVGVINIWYFRQVGDLLPHDRSDYYFRLVDVDFVPRLPYFALQQLADTLRVTGPGLAEETNPGVDWEGDWALRLNRRASGGAVLSSATVGDRLRFAFQGTGVTLVHPRSPQGGRLWATLDGRVIPTLPQDEAGRSVLDLFAPGEEWEVRTPLATSLQPGRHTLELAVAPSSRPLAEPAAAVDAFEVVWERQAIVQFIFFSLLALVSAALLASTFFMFRWR
ncbi:MAG: hypothetical protein HYY05_03975 [Chloroflexi bacterium]|nr:hypothetical protein [Chloroflexota bacterium]